MTAADVRRALRQSADPEKAAFFPRFFKAGPGQYAEGDKFLGVTVPVQRMIAKQYKALTLNDITLLLKSAWHEERLTALLIIVLQYQSGDEARRHELYDFYSTHTAYINNWDLVDSTAEHIVGAWLDGRPERMRVLERLAGSKLLWDRRIAMVATYAYIKQGRADEALVIADKLLYDKHDLIQKAVGWMLREIGKRVDHSLLAEFLDVHAATMPRTSLRYALEHFSPERRLHYMKLKRIGR